MRILLTGASSFTGMWFCKALAQAGHEVIITLRREPSAYADDDSLRHERVQTALEHANDHVHAAFGDGRFINAIKAHAPIDLLCHHAAEVTNYRSPDFDVNAALANNTNHLPAVLRALRDAGCSNVLLTGSIFEQNEGVGSDGLPAFNPYGLSKGLTFEVFRHYCRNVGMKLGKFIVPNPFGPYENPRFTDYLIRTWFKGDPASVRTPEYVRDNIHVSLLASAYAHFAQRLSQSPPDTGDDVVVRYNPSGYAESQGAFTQRFASEMQPRLNLSCELSPFEPQTEWAEPMERINTDRPDSKALGWSEDQAWDELADYYMRRYSPDRSRTFTTQS